MLKSIADDLERRRRIWPVLAGPLADVELDENTWELDYLRIGTLPKESLDTLEESINDARQ